VKFLLDACVSSRSLLQFLASGGHDVVSALSIDPRAADDRLLEQARLEGRVLITEDKDFGELLFVQGREPGPIVRLVELTVDEQVQAIDELLAARPHELVGRVIVTLTCGRMRIRRRNN
jgi:predicted nuclease of predicted toxin-antitoxin system